MSFIKTLTAVGAIALIASPAFAKAPSNDPANNLNRLLSGAKSMSANFSQTTKGAGKSSNFSGTMSVERPNKFRWETKSPSEQLIVANGSTMWIYDKDLAQATRQSSNDQLGESPALLLSGNTAQIAQNFTVKQPNPKKNYYVLTPKSANANFKNLAISFNGGKPVMMVLNDNLGQTTSIKFSNVTLNKAFSASQFAFTPPKGVDVIEQ